MIVAHTAIPEDQFGDCQEKGFDAFMQKPIDNDQLEKYRRNRFFIHREFTNEKSEHRSDSTG